MTDETRFAVTFSEDVGATLSGLRAHRATRRLALGLERTCTEQIATALQSGPRARAPWRALWLAVSEIVALGAEGDPDAVARLREFLDENADLVAPVVHVDRVRRYGARAFLTYASVTPLVEEPPAAAAAPAWATEWLLGAWSVVGVITGVAIAVRILS